MHKVHKHPHTHTVAVKVVQRQSCEQQQMDCSNNEAVIWQVMLFRACLSPSAIQDADGG